MPGDALTAERMLDPAMRFKKTGRAPVSEALTKKMLYDFLAATDVEEMEGTNHNCFGWVDAQPDASEGVV